MPSSDNHPLLPHFNLSTYLLFTFLYKHLIYHLSTLSLPLTTIHITTYQPFHHLLHPGLSECCQVLTVPSCSARWVCCSGSWSQASGECLTLLWMKYTRGISTPTLSLLFCVTWYVCVCVCVVLCVYSCILPFFTIILYFPSLLQPTTHFLSINELCVLVCLFSSKVILKRKIKV